MLITPIATGVGNPYRMAKSAVSAGSLIGSGMTSAASSAAEVINPNAADDSSADREFRQWQRYYDYVADYERQSAASLNAFNAEEAAKNRAFERESRLSYYADIMKSLESAGLNPALAYSQGNFSGLSGSTASGVKAGGVSVGYNYEGERLNNQERVAAINGIFSAFSSLLNSAGTIAKAAIAAGLI